uniref:Uncharacterized protein n=1 Tax=Pycnococcus provasolii TaxID=41880 RepID=A0A7S2AHA0_9CHLO|mmetsp:Transcript_10996/g.24857  ORF Transcript_10996/g.24857 Transcript_10996/m.24857 type:complete len:266 (+) Transcript_10996:128-925(+)
MLASYSYARARSKSISRMMFLVASIAIMLLQTSTTVCGVYAQEENGSVPPAGGDIIDAVNGNDQEVTLAMTMMAPGPEMDDTTLRSFFGGPGYGGYGPPRRPPYYGGGYGGYGPYMPYYGGYRPYYGRPMPYGGGGGGGGAAAAAAAAAAGGGGGGYGGPGYYPAQPAPYYPPPVVGGGGGGGGAGAAAGTATAGSSGRRTEISGIGINLFPWAPPPDPCVNLRGFYKYNCISENTGSTATASGGASGAGGGGGGYGGYPGRRRH